VTYVIANNIVGPGQRHTYTKHLGVCVVYGTDLDVTRTLGEVPDYLHSELIAANVTAAGLAGCEEWRKTNTAAGTKHFYVLPTGDGTGRIVQQRWVSPSYNETTDYEYWWTTTPVGLFEKQFQEWHRWNTSVFGCVDKRRL